MDHFYIITSELKDPGFAVAEKIRAYLLDRGRTCIIQTSPHDMPAARSRYTDFRRVPAETECVIVLGGDGSLIRASRDLFGLSIPIVGINLGTLGYLTEGTRENALSVVEELVEERFIIEERMMISGRVLRGGTVLYQDVALNEVVVTRNTVSMMYFDVMVGDLRLNSFAADGIILSTPTGSTAYNLSAGGPIVEPSASLFVLTPIAPHTMNNRSIILSPEDRIRIVLLSGKRIDPRPVVSFDGDQEISLQAGDEIEITRAMQTTRIINLSRVSFLENLSRKMS